MENHHFLMGKSTISMAMFHNQRVRYKPPSFASRNPASIHQRRRVGHPGYPPIPVLMMSQNSSQQLMAKLQTATVQAGKKRRSGGSYGWFIMENPICCWILVVQLV